MTVTTYIIVLCPDLHSPYCTALSPFSPPPLAAPLPTRKQFPLQLSEQKDSIILSSTLPSPLPDPLQNQTSPVYKYGSHSPLLRQVVAGALSRKLQKILETPLWAPPLSQPWWLHVEFGLATAPRLQPWTNMVKGTRQFPVLTAHIQRTSKGEALSCPLEKRVHSTPPYWGFFTRA